MRHIRFSDSIDTINQRLPFFLATEEWVARNLPEDDYFFSWQVDPTVICGRNQEIDKEVDLAYCRSNGIDVVRRRSGGGAVFADRENFMFSFITKGDNVTEEFARYTALIAGALKSLGLDAEATGRNDINIGGKKVSGNAFYHLPGRCIAHGTMLYNFDPRHLACALTPSKAKMESKGVKSVPKRVTCLKNENISLSPEEFERYMIESITDGNPYLITEDDYRRIKEIESGYYNPAFLRIKDTESKECQKNSSEERMHISRSTRIEGLGEFCVDFDVDNGSGIISNFGISGDFFMSADIESTICAKINGVFFSHEYISKILNDTDVSGTIPGLSSEKLLSIIFKEAL